MLMPYRSMKQGNCGLICIKLGSIGPSLGRSTSSPFRMRLLIWHTLYTPYTCKSFSSIILSFKIIQFLSLSPLLQKKKKKWFLSLSLKLVQECPYSIIYQISLILLFFLGLFFFFFHLILIQWLQMINIQEALQIREKWQIFYYLLSSRRKIAQDKIAHFSIIQKQFGKSISSSLFLFFLSQHILTFLVYFTKFRLFDGCYPIGALGG